MALDLQARIDPPSVARARARTTDRREVWITVEILNEIGRRAIPCSMDALRTVLNLTHQSVRVHVERLIELGLVETVRISRRKYGSTILTKNYPMPRRTKNGYVLTDKGSETLTNARALASQLSIQLDRFNV